MNMDEETRRRVLDRHRTDRKKRIDSMQETIRQLKRDINGFINGTNSDLQSIRDRITTLESACAYLASQDKPDDTTRKLPTLPDPGED